MSHSLQNIFLLLAFIKSSTALTDGTKKNQRSLFVGNPILGFSHSGAEIVQAPSFNESRKTYEKARLTQKACQYMKNKNKSRPYNRTRIHVNKLTGEKVVISADDCPIDKTELKRHDMELISGTHWKSSLLTVHSIMGVPQPIQPITQAQETTIKTPFIIQFSCNVPNAGYCPEAQKAYKAATDTIAKYIKITTPIILKASYISFCKVSGDCSGNILGQASSASQWSLKPSHSNPNIDPNYFYPQSLAKQISPPLNWAPVDIVAEFNDDTPSSMNGVHRFWFKEDGVDIQDGQYDFEYVILHEIMHGLGFTSSWNTYVPASDGSSMPLITPWYNFESDSNGNMIVNGINPPFIFDKYLVYSDGRSLSESHSIMSTGSLSNPQPYNQWVNTFLNSAAYTESKNLYQTSVTPQSLYFLVPGSKNRVALETAYNPFRPGSSITHVDQQIYSNEEDFLMRPEAQPGYDLDQIDHDKHPIGCLLLKIMMTIGYQVDLSQC